MKPIKIQHNHSMDIYELYCNEERINCYNEFKKYFKRKFQKQLNTPIKERAQKVIPRGTKKKESSAESQNDIKKSKSKSAKSYPRRHKKKRIAPQSL